MKSKILKKINQFQLDESKKFQDEIQKITDNSINDIENLTNSKESEILKV